jgi:SagB-type dehydrogenase family enzyme
MLLVRWANDGSLLALEPNCFREVRVNPTLIEMLTALSHPATADELGQRLPRYPVPVLRRLLGRLLEVDLVRVVGPGTTKGIERLWTPYELAVQRMLTYGNAREATTSVPPGLKPALPNARMLHSDGDLPFRDFFHVLRQRRSHRTFLPHPISLATIEQFLSEAARVQRVLRDSPDLVTQRPSPSTGARHPLELYLLCSRVTGLEPALYYYEPVGHSLNVVRRPDQRFRAVVDSVKTQIGVDQDPAVIVQVNAVFGRTLARYERMGLLSIYRDLGCLLQTMYLTATALGLAPCATGLIQDRRNAEWLSQDPLEEAQVGCFVIGGYVDPKASAHP